jgi:ribosomal protein S21
MVKGGVFDDMVFVKAGPGDSSDSLIRKFTRKVINEGLLLEFKKKEFYQKPAEVRKEAKNEIQRRDRARRRNRKR